jgi:hypothetical protein
VIALGTGGSAYATAKSWNVASGNWSLGTNWSPSGVPGALDTVTISSGIVTVDANVSVATISISGGTVTVSGATTTIATTGAFTLSGGTFTGGSATTNTITVGGDLALSSADASLVGYWKLDETASPAADSTSSPANLTWSGPSASSSVPTVAFSDTNSLTMNPTSGNSQYAATSMALSNYSKLEPATLTLSAWYRATNVDTSGAEVVTGSNCYSIRITSTGLSVMKRTHNGTGADWIEYRVAPSNYLDGNWHQIVGVIASDHSMSAYFDGSSIAGTYWSNGTGGGEPMMLGSPDLNPILYTGVDTFGLNIGRNPSIGNYDFGTGCGAGACAIDDVRVYNRALSSGEISTLSSGSQAGTLALNGPLSVSGNLTVSSSGTLTLVGANASISMASGKTLAMDGTLNSSTSAGTGPTIKGTAGVTYAFYVGSANGATPTLNISNLTVKNGDANGMRINGNGAGTTTATTTFKQFDNVTFSNGTTGGTAYLQIYASTLYLVSNGCSFGAGESSLPTAAVKLTGDGFTNGATETRAIFGGTTCANTWTGGGSDKICVSGAKSDDDSGNDGIGDHPSGAGINGAVVQFVRAAESDTKGTIEGFPTAAFSWTSFTYYSTYVAYHDADSTGTKDRVYVRKTDGTAASSTYYWEAPAGETIVGTPRWNTSGSTHYVYVALASGKVYQLVDDTSGHTLSTTGASWTTNPFTSATTITTPLAMDTTNLYFGGTSSGNKFWSVIQSTGLQTTGSPFSITGAVTAASPAVWTNGGNTYVTVGMSGQISHVDISNFAMTYGNTSPVGNVVSRIGYGTKSLTTLFVGDDSGGTMWGIDPLNSTNGSRWSFAAGGTTLSPPYYDYTGDTLMFGTSQGKLFSLSTASAASTAAMTGYSSGYQPNSNADAFSTAPLYSAGILVAGNTGGATTGGKLYFIDRNTATSSPCIPGSAPSLLKQYNFGPSESVSGVGYDASSSRYMAATSSSTNDGRLYYFDLLTDTTSCK